ncbi:ABC transporter ATP-binding protein [Methyloraptor flagellatus]|uniref:ABC transporter ATP-binding protein n=1 Tax=Methyloraptor flagellatus TaxID=3162530 RepID=A0AAU7X537_9HYPH
MTEAAPALPGHRLKLYGLSKRYGPHRALHDVTLEVAPGEFLTLLGPSGSGKTTVLMALAGFVEPSDGEIYLDGRPISALPPDRRDFGVVFQGYALFPHLSVAANVAFPLEVRGLGRADIRAKVAAALDLVRLGAFADRKPRALSGGQQQRVALARALVFEPKLLLLDEPMGALDRQLKSELQGELRRLHRRLGTTFVNVTHDQEEAMALSDRIAVMRGGEIVEVGTPAELYARPRTRFVASFLGRSNFLEGVVGAVRGGVANVEVGGRTIRHATPEPVAPGACVTLALRPERIELGPRDGLDNVLTGRLLDAVQTGPGLDLAVEVGLPEPLEVRIPPTASPCRPRGGDRARLGRRRDRRGHRGRQRLAPRT